MGRRLSANETRSPDQGDQVPVRVRAKKSLGQHFLVDRAIVGRILDALEARSGDEILEIGPGPGTLTVPMFQRGLRVTAIEIDRDMIATLEALKLNPPPTLIHGDFMDLCPQSLITKETKVVSNLPYNVSVPITAKLLEVSHHIPLMVMMYQKEVALRIRAHPNSKAYGPISVLVRCFYDVDGHFNVKPGSFRPPPKVDSQVIRLRRKAAPLIEETQLEPLTELVRFVFQQRRKMLRARIKSWQAPWAQAQALLQSLAAVGLDPASRPEQLTAQAYVAWYQHLKEHYVQDQSH